MVYEQIHGTKVSMLGMGNMRLPSTDPKAAKAPIDWPEAHKILDYAMAHGINYFDTAYVYNGGESESCVGEGMKKYPRDSFYLATKYFIGANPDYKEAFRIQCERLQTDHIDFYLIHCLMDNNIDTYLESGCIEYFMELQKQGKIKYLGFSSHASVETLKRFADHHQWDFAQLQINYFDWAYDHTQEEYKVLEERNIPIVVMEPVRGGRLASLTPDAEALLKAAHPDWSIASWALRFCRTLPMVKVILSGMSNMDQIEDNVNTFSDEEALSEADMKVLNEALELFHSQVHVACTACRYCCADCPLQINIPEYLSAYNTWKVDGKKPALNKMKKIESEGKPSDCVGCGSCTSHCPQSIDVPKLMEELATLEAEL